MPCILSGFTIWCFYKFCFKFYWLYFCVPRDALIFSHELGVSNSVSWIRGKMQFIQHHLIDNFETLINYTKVGSRGGAGGLGPDPPPPENSQKYRASYQNWSRSSEKSQGYQASIQCWAIIDTLSKGHLMALHWRVDNGPLYLVFGTSLSHQLKK